MVTAAKTSKLHASALNGLNKLFVRLGMRFVEYVSKQPEYVEGLKKSLRA